MKTYIAGVLFFLLGMTLFAQTGSAAKDNQKDGVYLIPQTIYVGDRGRLVLPLGAAYAEIEPVVVSEKNLLPSSNELVITRMEIERKTGVPRLLIDFQAYAPGQLQFPPLKIGGYEFTGLDVRISSILESGGKGDMVLSDAAPPMAVPGTIVIIYGSIAGIILAVLMLIFTWIWGVPHIRSVRKWRYRKLVLRSLQRSLHKMRNSIIKNGLSGNSVLTGLSQDFRKFLLFFTQANCFTMVPKEFLSLPRMMDPGTLKGGEVYIFEHPDVLYRIFKKCDDLRFSGDTYGTENVLSVLDDITRFAGAFESLEKESIRRDTSPVSAAPGVSP